MNHLFSLHVARLSGRGSRVALVAALCAGALLFSALSFAQAAAASSASPSGNARVAQAPNQFSAHVSTVHAAPLMLPATSCAALQKAQPGASCLAVSYTTLTIHPVLPHSKLAATVPATWYSWSYDKWECSFISCRVWGLHLQANGVTNHTSIWQYNVFCNASGLANCTWHGYSNNGTSSIEIGLNGQACASFCVSHGMRQWIHANVTLGTYYQW